MHYREILTEAGVPAISPQQANDAGMFGPLYHGTRGDLAEIIATGFDVAKSIPNGVGGWMSKPTGTSNGYALGSYGFTDVAAPVHHLGFGTYFTTSKTIAKQYAGGTMKGMRVFYLDSQRILEINFGSPNTMMRWWRSQDYDMSIEATKSRDVEAWKAATMKLTTNLQKDYDAVWFKGKAGIRRLLDGDQVCVYRPELLRVLDLKLARGVEIGAKVVHTQVIPERYRGSNRFYVDDPKPEDFHATPFVGKGWRGIYRADEEQHPNVGRYPVHWIPPPGMVGVIARHPFGDKFPQSYTVKWNKGGEMFNYAPEELNPAK